MLKEIGRLLDAWVIDQNVSALRDGVPQFRVCTVRILGPMALFEAELPLRLAATRDVDVRADYEDPIRREFERLLWARGLELEPHGDEIWMPRETRYTQLFPGKFVSLLLAEP